MRALGTIFYFTPERRLRLGAAYCYTDARACARAPAANESECPTCSLANRTAKSTFGLNRRIRCLKARKGSLLPLALGADRPQPEQAALPNPEIFHLELQAHTEQPQPK